MEQERRKLTLLGANCVSGLCLGPSQPFPGDKSVPNHSLSTELSLFHHEVFFLSLYDPFSITFAYVPASPGFFFFFFNLSSHITQDQLTLSLQSAEHRQSFFISTAAAPDLSRATFHPGVFSSDQD